MQEKVERKHDSTPGTEGSRLEQFNHYSLQEGERMRNVYMCGDSRWRVRTKELKILIFHSGSQQIIPKFKKQEMVIHE